MKDREVIFVITQMTASGAERMAALLCNEINKRGIKVTVIVTHQKKEEAYLDLLSSNIDVIILENELIDNKSSTIIPIILLYRARAIAKLERVVFHKDNDLYHIRKYCSRNYDKIYWLKKFFKHHSDAIVISFLYAAIFHILLSVMPTNRVIISERGDPEQCVGSRTNRAFFNTMFPKADIVVFQSESAKEWFDNYSSINGTVIYNPIREDLPLPFIGERESTVVNFCRYARQKNLILLIKAFKLFHQTHQDFDLRIIGGPSKDGGQEYIDQVKHFADTSECSESIQLLPESMHIHEDVLRDGMFVSSSDYEGMSNSMLEAMAIGLPSICTDCPAGGARAVIQDHVNGILTPVGDAEALARAMCEVADNSDFAEKLSRNGVKIRETQSVERIIQQWIEIIEN